MHLPRIGFDVIDLNESMILSGYDQPNSIIPLPSNVIASLYKNSMSRPTLIVFEDDCESSAKLLENKLGASLGCISISQLSNKTLKAHWQSIWALVKTDIDQSVINEQYLLLHEDDKRNILPLLFLSNQFDHCGDVLNRIYKASHVADECLEIQIEHHAHLAVWNKIINEPDNPINNKSNYKKLLIKSIKQATIPVVISMPGIASPQIKYHGRSVHLPEIEKQVITMLGIHRSIARNAVYLELDTAPKELFIELNQLEINCKQGTNNTYVWRTLKKIGKICRTI